MSDPNINRLNRLTAAVKAAAVHDRDCDEEGEGACCFRAWRRVILLAGAAPAITQEDVELMEADAAFDDDAEGGRVDR